MAITWSVSRDQTLHACERQYFFHYLAHARINSRDPMLREIAFLKKLKNISMWQGNVFHSLVAEYLQGIRQRKPVSWQNLLDLTRRQMAKAWAFSLAKEYRANPRILDQDDTVALYEHEYDDVAGEDEESVTSFVEERFHRFRAWAEDCNLHSAITSAERTWIEPNVYGPNAPGFVVDRAKVIVKVDLALQSAGRFVIFDWKTGVPPLQSPSWLARHEFQIGVYQLWPHLSFGLPLESIQADLVYLGNSPADHQSMKMDQNQREYTLSLVRRSISRTIYFGEKVADLGFSSEDFDFAAYAAACHKCVFKRLCQRILE